jgi:N-acetylglucosamine kinase-like BadF-type ATPase
MARLENALRGSVMEAFSQAGWQENMLDFPGLEAACCGMTGGWEWVPDVLKGFIRVRHLVAEPDMVTTHAGAFVGSPGVIVIAGTGSIAFGVNTAGTRQRAGGWGYLMGDEGSGYDIGRQALMAAARAEDGRGPRSSLLPGILEHFRMGSLWDMRTALYSGKISRPQIAEVAPLVIRAFQMGDEAARHIVDQAAYQLAELAAAVLGKLRWEGPAPVALLGGVFQAGAAILDPFQAYLTRRIPGTQVTPARFPPVIGALLLAYQAAGFGLDPESLLRLEAVSQHIQMKK